MAIKRELIMTEVTGLRRDAVAGWPDCQVIVVVGSYIKVLESNDENRRSDELSGGRRESERGRLRGALGILVKRQRHIKYVISNYRIRSSDKLHRHHQKGFVCQR